MHQPVLLEEIIEIFSPKPGQIYIDATVNGGGHALAILGKIGLQGMVLGIDRDCETIKILHQKIHNLKIKNVRLACDNFINIKSIARGHHLVKIDGIFFDLGFSSYHIEKSGRGFSFLRDEPLDMRYSVQATDLTAAVVVNRWPEKKIADILLKYGEERFSRRIARAIIASRKSGDIKSTRDLVKIISKVVPKWYCRGRIHCATKTFQALRIAVNDELANIEKALEDAIDILSPGGKIAAVSFHSLEDRIVKHIFKERELADEITLLTKKTIRPAYDEITANPRSRSARLRAAEKL